MSLQDESFPTDELFDQLNNLSSSGARNTWFAEHHKPAVFERDTAPFLEICYADPDFDADGDVANKSAKTCVSDPVGRDQEDEDDYDEDVDGKKCSLSLHLLNYNGRNIPIKHISYMYNFGTSMSRCIMGTSFNGHSQLASANMYPFLFNQAMIINWVARRLHWAAGAPARRSLTRTSIRPTRSAASST